MYVLIETKRIYCNQQNKQPLISCEEIYSITAWYNVIYTTCDTKNIGKINGYLFKALKDKALKDKTTIFGSKSKGYNSLFFCLFMPGNSFII